MSKILSMSLDDETLTTINVLQKEHGLGRSELIRSALQTAWSEHQNKAKIVGIIDAVMLIKHVEKNTEAVLGIRHAFEHLIKTHVHTHLENHKCLELLILKGKAEHIKKLANKLETSKKVEFVKLIVS